METCFFEGLKAVCLVEYQDNCFGFILSKKCYVDLALSHPVILLPVQKLNFLLQINIWEKWAPKVYIYISYSHIGDHHGRHIKDSSSILLRFKNMLDSLKYIMSTFFAPHLKFNLSRESQFIIKDFEGILETVQ